MAPQTLRVMPVYVMQGVQEGLQDLRTDLVTAEHVAEELKAMGLVTGSLLAVHSLLDLTPFKVSQAAFPCKLRYRLCTASCHALPTFSCYACLHLPCKSGQLHAWMGRLASYVRWS